MPEQERLMSSELELPRKEREQLLHKQQIVDTAMRLFSAKGFHPVSMQEIATQAQFAIGTLYRFFPSKEALYQEIMEQSCGRIMEIINPILESDADEREKVAKMIRASIDIFRKNAPAIRLFLQANQQRALVCSSTPPTENAGKFHETMLTNLQKVIASGVHKGVFRDMDPQVGALVLDATLRALIFSAAQASQEDLLERRIGDFEGLLFNGILNPQKDNHA
jgi:TetR/AcrR family transcriptional regulator